MNITKYSLGAAALAITLTIGGASVAMAGNGDGSGSKAGRDALIAKICENPDAAVAKITQRQTHVTERIAKLTELRTTANDAGHTKVVARLDQRIERLTKVLNRVTSRLDKAPAWIAEHCS